MQDHIELTQRWLEEIVIGLNLCPFAGHPFQDKTIRYVLVKESEPTEQFEYLKNELVHLMNTTSAETETTLLIFPNGLSEFSDYLDFLENAEQLLASADLEGIIQIASFHPDYQFAGTETEDAENYTNRSPYPMLHLLREASVEKAISTFIHVERIPERNIETMKELDLSIFEPFKNLKDE